MLYDLSTEIGKSRFNKRVGDLVIKGAMVDLTEKKPLITVPQNNYLHLLLGYFALETGNTLEYVKETYFKRTCNTEIFVAEREDDILKRKVKILRSSSSLDTSETTLAIQRFRDWSSSEVGIYLPEPNEDKFLNEIRVEMDRNKQYL